MRWACGLFNSLPVTPSAWLSLKQLQKSQAVQLERTGQKGQDMAKCCHPTEVQCHSTGEPIPTSSHRIQSDLTISNHIPFLSFLGLRSENPRLVSASIFGSPWLILQPSSTKALWDQQRPWSIWFFLGQIIVDTQDGTKDFGSNQRQLRPTKFDAHEHFGLFNAKSSTMVPTCSNTMRWNESSWFLLKYRKCHRNKSIQNKSCLSYSQMRSPLLRIHLSYCHTWLLSASQHGTKSDPTAAKKSVNRATMGYM